MFSFPASSLATEEAFKKKLYQMAYDLSHIDDESEEEKETVAAATANGNQSTSKHVSKRKWNRIVEAVSKWEHMETAASSQAEF